MMTFDFVIPTTDGPLRVEIEPGSSAIFVGANGGGKTRLAVHIENSFSLNAHRISAHRALTLNPDVAKISEEKALWGLRTGWIHDSNVNVQHRIGQRWQQKAAVSLLNDFDFLVQALFAEQSNTSLSTHKKARAGDFGNPSGTKFEHLIDLWGKLLPHREIHVSGDDIEVSVVDITGDSEKYKASEMSDGERAIFYLVAQVLLAANDSLLIFDEPELHVHRSIMAKLWDELEAARPDCAFVLITHDLDFAAQRVAQKFVIRDFRPGPNWIIDPVPDNTGFDEGIATLILGSRRPILFVEGGEDSLDATIYRCSYPNWTVIPRGSCEEVIHSVVTMRRNQSLTRVTCSGIVDADDYQPDDIARLAEFGVSVLPVSEIENIVLLPIVSRAIAETEGYEGGDLEDRLGRLKAEIFNLIAPAEALEAVIVRHCQRRIDRILKKIDLSAARDVAQLEAEYDQQMRALDITAIAARRRISIEQAITNEDLSALLAIYDNKGMMALAASHLKRSKLVDFESWLARILRNSKAPALASAIRSVLPIVHAI